MAKLSKKYIKLGTNTDELNSRDVPAHYTPISYVPNQVASEGNNKISAHLKGIDIALSSVVIPTDIGITTWSGLLNNTPNQNITGFLVSSLVRSFKAEINITIDDGSLGLYQHVSLLGVRKNTSDWTAYEISSDSLGDIVDLVDWSIADVSGDGQVRISLGNVSGFVSGTLKFRVITLS